MADEYYQKKPISAWIRRVINDTEADGGAISKIVLLHMNGTANGKELHAAKFGDKSWKAEDLADMFRSIADDYAHELPGTQSFQLVAFYGEVNHPQRFKPFRIKGDADHVGLGSEEPTNQGAMAQGMRYLDSFSRQVLERQRQLDDASAMMMQRQAQMIDTLSGHIHRLQEDQVAAFNAVQQMVAEKLTAENDRTQQFLAFQRATQERQALLQLAPALVNTLTGREVFPQSTEDTALIQTLVDNLQPEHMPALMKLAETLPATVQAPLMDRLNRAFEAREKKEAAQRLAARNPEAEAEHGE